MIKFCHITSKITHQITWTRTTEGKDTTPSLETMVENNLRGKKDQDTLDPDRYMNMDGIAAEDEVHTVDGIGIEEGYTRTIGHNREQQEETCQCSGTIVRI